MAADQALSVCNTDHTSCLAASGYVYTAGSELTFNLLTNLFKIYTTITIKFNIVVCIVASESQLSEIICVTVMKMSDLSQQYNP